MSNLSSRIDKLQTSMDRADAARAADAHDHRLSEFKVWLEALSDEQFGAVESLLHRLFGDGEPLTAGEEGQLAAMMQGRWPQEDGT